MKLKPKDQGDTKALWLNCKVEWMVMNTVTQEKGISN